MNIVVATNDALGDRMAGPAIRAWHMADALADAHEVTLFTTGACDATSERFAISRGWTDELKALEQRADVIVFQGFVLDGQPWLAASNKTLVVDLYDPFHLEQLELSREAQHDVRVEVVASTVAVLNEQVARGDFFLCASEKQRDFWLGQLAAVGRINPLTYDGDESLRNLIDVVPFGVGEKPPVKEGPAIRGVVAGIDDGDDLLLWGGGVYNWFDPQTLVRAVAELRARRPRVRLYFLGMKHPNPEVPQMRTATETMALSDALGLTGTHVFFNHDWVPYARRGDWLLEADIGVSTHLDHVETAFSFRTRVLDYLWASLPVVCTQGDSMAELVEAHGLGATVPAGDPSALAQALGDLLDDPDRLQRCRNAVATVADRYRWSTSLAPLVRFCATARRARDLTDPETAPRLAAAGRTAARQRRGPWHNLASARRHLRNGRTQDLLAGAARTARSLRTKLRR
ncbi:MAG TPA: glycosyltransferase [Acidimicrobiales bacterium]|nr:glycosyltransferase [Acidimicrobiales bacterium]